MLDSEPEIDAVLISTPDHIARAHRDARDGVGKTCLCAKAALPYR